MMKINEAIDFETFYYHRLLEIIIKKSQEKLPESLQQSVQNFVDFLSSEISPLMSIEKLAHLQGTSDLSIFFSDLIERLSDYDPDQAMQNLDEYARDFLEIYKELAKDEGWQRAILEDLLGKPEEEVALVEEPMELETAEEEGIDFNRFIYHELFETVKHAFDNNAPDASESVEKFMHRVENVYVAAESFDIYRSNPLILPVNFFLG
ncbi:MAG: hypothetical protein JSW33_16605 [bacterium]|nr:MAG: hypothetical protein JSW33_16605 [bacterium]